MTSWTVHSTVAEPPELLAAFVAHYLSLGADQVHLCLDRWDVDTLDILSGFDRLTVTLCDDAYWASLGRKRPADQEGRQMINAQSAFEGCTTDWFFFCDADEFLSTLVPVTDLLDGIPADANHMRVRMAERVFPLKQKQKNLFDGPLRRNWHTDPQTRQSVYGPMAKYLTSGLSGHDEGKSFVRRGAPVRIRIHFPFTKRLDRFRSLLGKPPEKGDFLTKAWLVHFDGLTRLHWRSKLVRLAVNRPLAFAQKSLPFRLIAHALGWYLGFSGPRFRRQSRGREQQIADMQAALGNPEAIIKLDGVITLTKDQRDKLREEHKALIRLPLNPAAALEALRPDLDVDLSAARFNARLRQANPEFCKEIGLPIDP